MMMVVVVVMIVMKMMRDWAPERASVRVTSGEEEGEENCKAESLYDEEMSRPG